MLASRNKFRYRPIAIGLPVMAIVLTLMFVRGFSLVASSKTFGRLEGAATDSSHGDRCDVRRIHRAVWHRKALLVGASRMNSGKVLCSAYREVFARSSDRQPKKH